MASDLVNAMKPGPLKVRKKGDPEQLLLEFSRWEDNFKEFLIATEIDGEHAEGHAEVEGRRCGGCRKAKAYLKLVGGEEVKNLYDHVGHVVEEDSFDEALEKIKTGIKRQTNQATARFKLFNKCLNASRYFLRLGLQDQGEVRPFSLGQL